MVGDKKGGAAHALSLVSQQVAALGVCIIRYYKTYRVSARHHHHPW